MRNTILNNLDFLYPKHNFYCTLAIIKYKLQIIIIIIMHII